MLNLSITLKHYKRKDIQDAIIDSSMSREIAVRFGENGFGKRPDTLTYPNEILEYAKQGATSFHVSEEHWNNVLSLKPELTKKELDGLRKAWDLVIDVDCKYWDYSKLITKLIIEQLKVHGIKSVSVKFSGSKGFHIGVPFEAFPKTVVGNETRLLFPEAPKRILSYIQSKIHPILTEKLKEDIKKDIKKKEIMDMFGKHEKELFKQYCKKCEMELKESNAKTYFICPKCEEKCEEEIEYKICSKCKSIMERIYTKQAKVCPKCGTSDPKDFEEKLTTKLIDLDAQLISSRHMYRMPYSLHEKSGLCSVVINPERVMEFEKEDALPSKVVPNLKFLDTAHTKEGEAAKLLMAAFEYKPVLQEEKIIIGKEYEIPAEAIPIELFPPCILKGLNGLEDGRKRFMFALMNFLESCGYGYQDIEKIVKVWNKKNKEQLREVLINGQLRYRKTSKEKILPPNCMRFYQDMQLCTPDTICQKTKNPVQYAKYRSFMLNAEEKKEKGKKEKLTEEQKEMRRKFRESIKNKE